MNSVPPVHVAQVDRRSAAQSDTVGRALLASAARPVVDPPLGLLPAGLGTALREVARDEFPAPPARSPGREFAHRVAATGVNSSRIPTR